MAAAVASRHPTATLLATAAVVALVLVSLTAAPASASQLNFYSLGSCQGNFLKSCFDNSCCVVPEGAASYRFYYNQPSKATLYGNSACTGSRNGEFNSDVLCTDGVFFKSAYLGQFPPAALEMVTEQ